MSVLCCILFLRFQNISPNFITDRVHLFEKMDQVGSQTFLPAEKYVVSVPEQVIETKSIESHAGTTNFPQRVFGNVRNISFTIVDVVGQFLNKRVESVVIGTNVQSVTRRAFEFVLAVFG